MRGVTPQSTSIGPPVGMQWSNKLHSMKCTWKLLQYCATRLTRISPVRFTVKGIVYNLLLSKLLKYVASSAEQMHPDASVYSKFERFD